VLGSVAVALGDDPVGTYLDALDPEQAGRGPGETTSVGAVLAQVVQFAEAMVPLP
jgi:hypothetical protein